MNRRSPAQIKPPITPARPVVAVNACVATMPVVQQIRKPVAPPAYRPAQQQTAQPKMPNQVAVAKPSLAPTRPAMVSASGSIQVTAIGGLQALRARLAGRTAPQAPPVAKAGAANQVNQKPANKPPQNRQDKPATIQRKGRSGVEAFKVSLQPKSGGQPLPAEVQAKMEMALGADFSDVRIHVGREASSIGALAYTWGTNIHFAPGQYNPHSIQGQKILGHELWHVVQQKMGRVSNPLGGGVAVVQDHALEAEADRMGVKAAMTVLPRKPGDNR